MNKLPDMFSVLYGPLDANRLTHSYLKHSEDS